MERLAARGWRTIGIAELSAIRRGERAVAKRELVITFDDAYRGLRDHAFPILHALGFQAVCFVITDFAGRLNRWDVAYGGRRFAHLGWRDMRRWQERGITFASHTATHPRLTWLDEARARRELARSHSALQQALDTPVRAVSYPFGAAGEREMRLALEAGYEFGFTLGSATDLPDVRLSALAIPRLPVYAWSPPVPGAGYLRAPERWLARMANRCAVGTTIWQRWTEGETATRSTSRPPEAASDGA
ncbi:MAG TPA: polysaccharide deacetylase family protein [Gemmatimonadaceae bacterium]|nr:polysaccharide deacetylase family protein [Gemmatimonadaceae bacterium]